MRSFASCNPSRPSLSAVAWENKMSQGRRKWAQAAGDDVILTWWPTEYFRPADALLAPTGHLVKTFENLHEAITYAMEKLDERACRTARITTPSGHIDADNIKAMYTARNNSRRT
jgi:hypothetical protein